MPTLAETRARVETDLDDATLQTILDSETESLQREAGGPTETETQFASGLKKIILKRKPASITSITERGTLTAAPVTLATNDWRQTGLYGIYRLADGTNPAVSWGAEVVIAYVPELDAALRDRVIFDLVQLAVEFRAFDSEEAGDWKGTQKDFNKRRKAVLAQVSEGRGLIS